MKIKNKKNLIIITTIIVAFSSPLNVKAITIEDTTFSVSIGQQYNWIYTEGSWGFNISDRVRFTIEDLYKGNYFTEPVAILNGTIEYYWSFRNAWSTVGENWTYMYFNETTNFIKCDVGYYFVYMWLFVLPTPLNLTLFGDYFSAELGGDFVTITVIGNQLVMYNLEVNMTISFDYNDNGIMTKSNLINGSTPILTLEFTGLSSSVREIPFGFTFPIIMVISWVIIILPMKKKKN